MTIRGGKSLLGTNSPQIHEDGEGPLRTLQLKQFTMSETTVTNAQFEKFVQDTGYITEAEQFGWSFVFWSDVSKIVAVTEGVAGIEWWRKVYGANWRNVDGSDNDELALDPVHPVIHISWNDAKSYATWAGGRLPTEAEWEHAARGGHGDEKFPWGSAEPNDTDALYCNIWQGSFPKRNTCADGYSGTAPAKSFKPNGYGLYNMVGNVWEWTSDPFKISSLKKDVRRRLSLMKGFKLLKGGSFLCHHSYCYRYRIAARSGNSPESTTSHQGFRVVWDTPSGVISQT